jgi:hypothetical protein
MPIGRKGPALSLENVWPFVTRAALELTSDPSTARVTLAALHGDALGLAPVALLDELPCLAAPYRQELQRALLPTLTALAELAADPSLQRAALALLGGGGTGALPPALAAIASQPGHPDFGPLLERLARSRAALSPAWVEPLRRAYDGAEAWPVRWQIARVLGPDVGSERLRREPIALVRDAAARPRGDGPVCAPTKTPN